MSFTTDPATRQAFITGLRDLADLPRAEELTIALRPHRPEAADHGDAAAYVEAES